MAMTKQQKALAGVLGVAGLALAADRMFLGGGGPRTAAAEVLQMIPGVEPAPASTTPAAAPEPSGNQRLASLILAAAEQSGVDASSLSSHLEGGFEADVSWRPTPPPPAQGSQTVESPAAYPDMEIPPPPRLSAVLRGERSGAILNDRFVRVGGEIGVYTVREVQERTVVLDGPAGAVVLRIETPLTNSGG